MGLQTGCAVRKHTLLGLAGIDALFWDQKAGGSQLHLLSIQAAAALLSVCQPLVLEPLPQGREVKPFQVSYPALHWPRCHQLGEEITELSHLM